MKKSAERKGCAWCGSPVSHDQSNAAVQSASLCPDCDATFEHEAHRPAHANEIRIPHND